MKFSSALTLTTVVSVITTVHGAPVLSPDPIHFRRHSSVSELSGRQMQGTDFMDSLGAAFEPENGIGKLLNFVKRQLGSTDSTSVTGAGTASSGSGSNSGTSGASSSTSSTAGSASNPQPHNTQTDNSSSGPAGLMGGGLSSPQEAGFAFEPGQDLRAA